eukprot:CAMPEP_0170511032 /NCGR_PEP_ID=MMETSP0208-20121228/66083_1 /TAXON_ID=197538 /ORGANISM="Strombidium inclinatum, Strain S3" /LENGTH=55 /DNA_ID=CAMNT_0010794535 /DNA_START=3160 /DNA_END=3327 /DNA_ORIENTATION=+
MKLTKADQQARRDLDYLESNYRKLKKQATQVNQALADKQARIEALQEESHQLLAA